MRKLSQRFRELMLDAVRDTPNALVSASGGIDSSTILAAQLELGYHPVMFSFHVDGLWSADFETAKRIAEAHDLELVEVIYPNDVDWMIHNVRQVLTPLAQAGYPMTRAKVYVQVTGAMLPVIHAMRQRAAIGLCGMRADFIYGSSEHDQRLLKREGEEALRKVRRSYMQDPHTTVNSTEFIASLHGFTMGDPYRHLVDLIVETDMAQLHRGYPKSIAVEAFPEFWAKGAFLRRPVNLQIGSGIRDLHDRIFLSQQYNPKGWSKVVAVYRDLVGV